MAKSQNSDAMIQAGVHMYLKVTDMQFKVS